MICTGSTPCLTLMANKTSRSISTVPLEPAADFPLTEPAGRGGMSNFDPRREKLCGVKGRGTEGQGEGCGQQPGVVAPSPWGQGAVGPIPWLHQSFLHLILEAFLHANNSSPTTAPPGDKSQRCHLQWHKKEAGQADPAQLQGSPHSKHPWLKHLSTDPKNQ